MKRIRSFFIFTALLCLTACKEDVQNTYSNYPAYFVYKNVNTVPQLNAALNSLGVYTAIAGNSSIQMGIAGFIAGLPNIPELGSTTSLPVCYDLACPNCYSAYNISRALQLKEGGYAACVSCGRTYNLNNQGQISIGEEGVSLFRYRITYSGNTMVINNR